MKLKKISLILISIVLFLSISACDSEKRSTGTISGKVRSISYDEDNQIKYVFLIQYLEETNEYATFGFSVSENTKYLNSKGDNISPDSLEKDMEIEITYYEVDVNAISADAAEIKVLD